MTIITVSRGSYSGGTILARCVAEKLGYECVSREDNHRAAATLSGAPVEMLTSEKAPALSERLGGRTETFPYLTYVRAALCQRARSGDLVYHGLLGHLILPDFPNLLRVRVVADTEYRVEAVMREKKLARPEALAYIGKVDHERGEWARSLFGVEWDDLSRYDVVLNLSLLGIDAACDGVAHLARHPRFAATGASRKAIEDLSLASMVSAALVGDPSTATADLKVVADGGVVTVTGAARTKAAVEAVPGVASRVAGVTEARSKVKVGRAPEG